MNKLKFDKVFEKSNLFTPRPQKIKIISELDGISHCQFVEKKYPFSRVVNFV